MGDGAGILIQIPDAFYRSEMAAAGRAAAAAGRVRRRHDLPAEGTRLAPGLRAGTRAHGAAEGQVVLGWRDVPVDREMPMSPTVREQRAGDPADLHRPRRRRHGARRARAQALRDPQDRPATRSRRLQAQHGKEYYVPRMSTRTIVYKGLLLADQVGRTTATCRTNASSRRSRWCTSASRPTPFPSGSSRTRTGWSRTTARSTPSRATSTGCARARA